jgi:Tfp pilus assembly protein PilO
MSEQTPSTRRTINAERIRAGLKQLDFGSDQRILGPAEVIGLAGSLFILILVVVSYLYFLLPATSRLDALTSERSLLQTKLADSQKAVVQGESAQAAAQKIAQSLDSFENQALLTADRGRMGLYDSLNVVIRNNGLRNTSGPTYTPLEPAGSKTGSGSKSANTKWQSIYPGIAISVTVEGQYQNLRHFIRDLEMNKQLVIINSVELERSTETNNLPSAEGEQPSASRPAIISLRLEMSTYFQRGAVADSGTNEVAR